MLLAGAGVLGGCAPAGASAPRRYVLRAAAPEDLQFVVSAIFSGKNGFPDVWTRLTNTSGESVVVDYGPRSVVVHVGPFVRFGRNLSFDRRRQVLEPGESLAAAPPSGVNVEFSPHGEVELLVPDRLPPGTYEVWATFLLDGARHAELHSNHVKYSAE